MKRYRTIAAWTGVLFLLSAAAGLAVLSTPLNISFLSQSVSFEQPIFLVGVPLVFAYFIVVNLVSLRDGVLAQSTLHALAAGVLFLVLANPVLKTRTRDVHLVIVEDRSASISQKALKEFKKSRSRLKSAATNKVDVISFGDQDDSDLETAINRALIKLPGDAVGRIVLQSDGRQTTGDVLTSVSTLNSAKVRVFPELNPAPAAVDSGILGITAPEVIKKDQQIRVRVEVRSSQKSNYGVRLTTYVQPPKTKSRDKAASKKKLDSQLKQVKNAQARNSIEFEVNISEAGYVTFDAQLEALSQDKFSANNHVALRRYVEGPPRALIFSDNASRSRYLQSALNSAHTQALTFSASALSRDLLNPLITNLVVVDGVSPANLAGLSALKEYAALGGTVLFVASDKSYFKAGTALAASLPLMLMPRGQEEEANVALSLVIDRSGSMSSGRLEMAKTAAKLTIETLSHDDLIEIIGFDSRPRRIVRFQPASNRNLIFRNIDRLSASGGTQIYYALAAAYDDLKNVSAKTKHVILLTDGRAPARGIPELAELMRVEGITISTVGLGKSVEPDLLEQIAELGRGSSYFTASPEKLPRIFLKDALRYARPSLGERRYRVSSDAAAGLARFGDYGFPSLRGRQETVTKAAPAQTLLKFEDGRTLLARKPLGKGYFLAWSSDLAGRWGSDWLRWSRLPQFLRTLIKMHDRRSEEQSFPLTVDPRGRVIVDAYNGARFENHLQAELALERIRTGRKNSNSKTPTQAGHSDSMSAPFELVGPGLYVAQPSSTNTQKPWTDDIGQYDIKAEFVDPLGVPKGKVAGIHHVPYPRELRAFGNDASLLKKLARATEGRLLQPAQVTDALKSYGDTAAKDIALWKPLIWSAFTLFLISITLRRLKLRQVV